MFYDDWLGHTCLYTSTINSYGNLKQPFNIFTITIFSILGLPELTCISM